MPKYILIIGNLVDGHQFVGPFEHFDDADNASAEYDGPTWIQSLEEPKEYESS